MANQTGPDHPENEKIISSDKEFIGPIASQVEISDVHKDVLKKTNENINPDSAHSQRVETLEGVDYVENAKKELARLGIDSTETNIALVVSYMRTLQVHKNDRELYELSGKVIRGTESQEKLIAKMESQGITAVIHCEGPTVWDHIKTGMEYIESMDVSDDKKKLYKFLFLIHDIGKTDSSIHENPDNAMRNNTPLVGANGNVSTQYMIRFIRHSNVDAMTETSQSMIEQFASDMKISPDLLKWFIEKHMSGGIINADAFLRKAVEEYATIDSLSGVNDKHEVFKDLTNLLMIDGNATKHFDVKEGLKTNEKKSNFNVDRLLKNIDIYNGVVELTKDKDVKVQSRRENLMNAFFNKVNNFAEIDDIAVNELKLKINAIKPEAEVVIPLSLKKLGGVLRDKTVAVAPIYMLLVEKKKSGNEMAYKGILKQLNKLALSEEQISAIEKAVDAEIVA